MKRLMKFLKGDVGGATVEFVAILPIFLIIAFFIIEVALALFWWQTAVKAAQVGVRRAVVTDWIVQAPANLTNVPSSGAPQYGAPCDITQAGSDPCYNKNFTTASCNGTSCANQTPFNYVYGCMKAILPNLQPANVTVTYTYAGVGFVGGPLEPAVTVTVSGVPFTTGFADLLGSYFGVSLTTIPTFSTTLTAEDLSTSNSLGSTGGTNPTNTLC
jgi:Flp pilus assembly protein TadG